MEIAFGVTKRALRFYEDRGLIHPKRDQANVRLYSPADQSRVSEILRRSKQRFTLTDIKSALENPKLIPKQLELQLEYLNNELEDIKNAVESVTSDMRS